MELEVGPTLLVERKALFHDVPAHGLIVLEGREGMPEPRSVQPKAPEGAELLAPVGMSQSDAVARRTRDEALSRVLCGLLDAFDEPEATVQPQHRAGRQHVVGRVVVDTGRAGAAASLDAVRLRHLSSLRGLGQCATRGGAGISVRAGIRARVGATSA